VVYWALVNVREDTNTSLSEKSGVTFEPGSEKSSCNDSGLKFSKVFESKSIVLLVNVSSSSSVARVPEMGRRTEEGVSAVRVIFPKREISPPSRILLLPPSKER
jgi:hypothetical protein